MMNILNQWRDCLLDPPIFRFPKVVTATGERVAHLGPRFDFARIHVRFEPADEFSASWEAPAGDPDEVEFIRGALFGVLDILVSFSKCPVINVKVVIERMEIDAVDSNAHAFRLAGRDAAQKALLEAGIRQWDFA
jgi:hypothetical protein